MRAHAPRGLAVVGALVALVAGVLVAVALAGCGGDGAAEGTDRRAETAIVEDDQALAEDIVLRLSDFPTGWMIDPDEDDESEVTIYDRCVNLDLSELVTTGTAKSPTFLSESATSVSDTVVARSAVNVYAESAEQAFEQLASDETARCIQDFLQEAIETELDESPDVELGDVTRAYLSFSSMLEGVPPHFGDRSWAYEIVLEVKPTESAGPTMQAHLDVVFIQRGRGVAALVFADVLTFSEDLLAPDLDLRARHLTQRWKLEAELAERVSSRMSDAL